MQSAILKLTAGISALILIPMGAESKATSKKQFCSSGLTKDFTLSKACGGKTVKLSFLKLENDAYQVEACIPVLKVNTGTIETFPKSDISLKMKHASDSQKRSIGDIIREGRQNTRIHFPEDRSRIVIRTLGTIETNLKGGGATEDCNLFIDRLGDPNYDITISSEGTKPLVIKPAEIPSQVAVPSEDSSSGTGGR